MRTPLTFHWFIHSNSMRFDGRSRTVFDVLFFLNSITFRLRMPSRNLIRYICHLQMKCRKRQQTRKLLLLLLLLWLWLCDVNLHFAGFQFHPGKRCYFTFWFCITEIGILYCQNALTADTLYSNFNRYAPVYGKIAQFSFATKLTFSQCTEII